MFSFKGPVFSFLLAFVACSCVNFQDKDDGPATPAAVESDSIGFQAALDAHLNAVRQHDFEALKRTVPASGPMHLVLPNGAHFATAEEFLSLHEEWFQDTTWTMETKVQHIDPSADSGIALVEAINREPERNGKPYFHKMFITYSLKKVNGQWLVVYDHASTIEKSE
ncbi:MAG: nuclear transport factor 2 family protein [Phaeodactylibacter sp.]|nr:nuclear transport factor 2 family protein [Phaeodactylibacter sp.]